MDVKRLSHSQISLYQSCPLHYRLEYIDNLPTKDKSYFSFGTVLHQCAEYFFGVPVPPPPQLDQLLKFYEGCWISDGYESQEQEANYKSYGKAILAEFWKIHSADFRLPLAVERSFTVDIGHVKLSGKIDRIDKLESGRLSIVDYKSGKVLFTKDYLEQDLQLTLYQVAAERLWDIPVEKLTLYHLGSNTPCSCSGRTREQLEDAIALVHSVAEAIAREEFPARENQYCPCDFPEHCPYYRHKYDAVELTPTAADVLHDTAVAEAVERYADLQSQIKSLELELDDIRQQLIDFCQSQGLNRVFGRNHSITYKLIDKTGFDEDAVRTVLEPAGLWDEVLSFSESKLKQLIQSGATAADLGDRLKSLRRNVSQYPKLWVKKLAEEE